MNSSLNVKELVLGIVFVVVSFVTFYFWKQVIGMLVDSKYSTPLLVAAGVGLTMTAVLFCLLSIFGRNIWLRYACVAAGVIVPFFLVPAGGAVFALLVISLLFALFAAKRMRTEYNESSLFQLSRILRAGLSIFLSVLSIIVSTFYYVDFKEVRSVNTLIPKSLVDATAGRVSTFIGYPAYDPNQTIDDYLSDYITEQLKKRNISVSGLSKTEFHELVSEQRANFSSQIGVPVKGNERVGDVTYIALTEKMKQILKPIEQYIPFITAAAFFLGFKSLMLPLYYVVFLILYLVIKVLTSAKFFRKEVREIEVEKLTL